MVESLGESEDGEVRSGNLYIQLVPTSQRKLTQKQWEAKVIKDLHSIPDARVTFQSQSDGEGRDLTLYVVGSNPQLVEQTAREADRADARAQGVARSAHQWRYGAT